MYKNISFWNEKGLKWTILKKKNWIQKKYLHILSFQNIFICLAKQLALLIRQGSTHPHHHSGRPLRIQTYFFIFPLDSTSKIVPQVLCKLFSHNQYKTFFITPYRNPVYTFAKFRRGIMKWALWYTVYFYTFFYEYWRIHLFMDWVCEAEMHGKRYLFFKGTPPPQFWKNSTK